MKVIKGLFGCWNARKHTVRCRFCVTEDQKLCCSMNGMGDHFQSLQAIVLHKAAASEKDHLLRKMLIYNKNTQFRVTSYFLV
jgi:hypothetical protein